MERKEAKIGQVFSKIGTLVDSLSNMQNAGTTSGHSNLVELLSRDVWETIVCASDQMNRVNEHTYAGKSILQSQSYVQTDRRIDKEPRMMRKVSTKAIHLIHVTEALK